MNLNFEPTTLSFEDIKYEVTGGRQILNGVFGFVKPRECLAIMGGSGAGKLHCWIFWLVRTKMVKSMDQFM